MAKNFVMMYNQGMTQEFEKEDLVEAYKLVSSPALICTKGARAGLYDITPIGWVMPMDYEPVTKIIISCDPSHQCCANIKRSKQFAVAIPIGGEKSPVVKNCGSVSSPEADKFAQFKIAGERAEKIDVAIPARDVCAWIECALVRVVSEGSVNLIIGEAVAAFKRKER